MKKLADYVTQAKDRLGDRHMSDRRLGELLGGYSTTSMSQARYGRMSDGLAVKLATVLDIDAGELIWAARTARELDPVVRGHLEAWQMKVRRALDGNLCSCRR